ncbi:hypothetical protein EJ08DRAFT_665120 [Tothia fuscella]|uniref:Uncharacterized protein n=1 Tax=Tothia fuscella TaxID=1048955 RepID=A0A9P4NHN4_9PEZI|nr:hypothetical protein EJ08DRAFT_665120 [Tothia fuscella]
MSWDIAARSKDQDILFWIWLCAFTNLVYNILETCLGYSRSIFRIHPTINPLRFCFLQILAIPLLLQLSPSESSFIPQVNTLKDKVTVGVLLILWIATSIIILARCGKQSWYILQASLRVTYEPIVPTSENGAKYKPVAIEPYLPFMLVNRNIGGELRKLLYSDVILSISFLEEKYIIGDTFASQFIPKRFCFIRQLTLGPFMDDMNCSSGRPDRARPYWNYFREHTIHYLLEQVALAFKCIEGLTISLTNSNNATGLKYSKAIRYE